MRCQMPDEPEVDPNDTWARRGRPSSYVIAALVVFAALTAGVIIWAAAP